MSQVFYANPLLIETFTNGAIGYRPCMPLDPLGPYAKVKNCPVEGLDRRYTCYATGYADTYFSIPACVRIKGHYIKGYFSLDDGAITFRPLLRYHAKLGLAPREVANG